MRAIAGDHFDVYSAGHDPAGFVHPLAIETMSKIRIDISGQRSKNLTEFKHMDFDYVAILCDNARKQCGSVKGKRGTYHWLLEDPTRVLDNQATAFKAALQVRGELRERITSLVNDVVTPSGGRR